ncbi:hypothetical protein KFK09_019821 [Dendrobium nobile]|uniref:Uncharacterized protein n=1 Tax=Dendrobium nobile TaxID=94219 RepID=A0A8T3AR78_DENNO|nr:hypothetical protein KFK09_019821 [Dendrobium nobile]
MVIVWFESEEYSVPFFGGRSCPVPEINLCFGIIHQGTLTFRGVNRTKWGKKKASLADWFP